MTAILGIDPGPTQCGLVMLYLGRITDVTICSVAEALDAISCGYDRGEFCVAIERVQSCGQAGASLLSTSEVVGRLQQRALDSGHETILLYRRAILAALDITGRGNRDAIVRQRLIEMFGGSKEMAVGTRKDPGPLYGVHGHAWQALAVAVTAQMVRQQRLGKTS
ncbi:MAG: hypothetical protein HYZ29_25930 [Myxococcales bacterium]|nr:hypothetical protein [Myxococcales bacterium]